MSLDDWFKSAFSDDYIRIYAHRDQEEAQTALRSLTARLPISATGRYLDLCCGFARHLEYLNSLNINTIGCDLSMDLMTHAHASIRQRLVQANMLQLPYQAAAFDGVFSFFTSFGYFEDDALNAQVITEMARVLKPNGCLLMDFLNPSWVRNTLTLEDETDLSEFKLTQRRWINETNQTVNKEMIIEENGNTRTYYERVKLYTIHQFQAFFESAGLELRETFGTPQGTPLTEDTPRQIMIAYKL